MNKTLTLNQHKPIPASATKSHIRTHRHTDTHRHTHTHRHTDTHTDTHTHTHTHTYTHFIKSQKKVQLTVHAHAPLSSKRIRQNEVDWTMKTDLLEDGKAVFSDLLRAKEKKKRTKERRTLTT